MDKAPESNAAESNALAAPTNSIAELRTKVDVIMHRLSNITYQMEQLSLSNSDKNVSTSNSNSPARKLPAFSRMNAVLTNPTDDQDMKD